MPNNMGGHVRVEHCGNPNCNGCVVCDCFVCSRCGLLEGALTTECPGVESYREHGDAVYKGEIDYVDGKWVPGVSKHSPAAYKHLHREDSESTEVIAK